MTKSNERIESEDGGTWILYRWKAGTNVLTPYMVLSTHDAIHNPWVARDWERIIVGGRAYIYALKKMLTTEAIHDNQRKQQG